MARDTLSAVEFIPPDDDANWHQFWTFVSRNRRFGAMAMVKWRSFGIGFEWFEFNWLAVFVGPLCLTLGRIKPAPTPSSGDHHE